MHERNRLPALRAAAQHAARSVSCRDVGIEKCKGSGFVPLVFFLAVLSMTGCANLTGWHIPGTEKSAEPTTKVYLVLENVETIPEGLRTQGEIFVDDAYFGQTSRPAYSRFVGNALVVGTVQIEKEKLHTIRVVFPCYEQFEHTRYFGTLTEYSVSFRLKRLETTGDAISEQ